MSIVQDLVADIVETRRSETPEINPAYYPYAYAYDFVIENPDTFRPLGAHDAMRRGQADAVIRSYAVASDQPLVDVFAALADGYLTLHNFRDGRDVRSARMRYVREYDRDRLGLVEPAPVLTAA